MNRSTKDKPMFTVASRPSPNNVPNMVVMTERLGLDTAPAVWPTGVSLLAQAIDACQRCDTGEVCGDWLKRAPKSIEMPPAFCPNAPEFRRAKQAKER